MTGSATATAATATTTASSTTLPSPPPFTSSTTPSLQTYVEELVEKHKDQIVETTGEQGDLLVMHPLLVHAPSDALRCTLMEKEVRAATITSTFTSTITSTSSSASTHLLSLCLRAAA